METFTLVLSFEDIFALGMLAGSGLTLLGTWFLRNII